MRSTEFFQLRHKAQDDRVIALCSLVTPHKWNGWDAFECYVKHKKTIGQIVADAVADRGDDPMFCYVRWHDGELEFLALGGFKSVADDCETFVPWLLRTKGVLRTEVEYLKKAKRLFLEIDKWQTVKMATGEKRSVKILTNEIHKKNTASIEFLRWLGFDFVEHEALPEFLRFFKMYGGEPNV